MTYKESHIRALIRANNDNRLAIFVGAGVSTTSETEEQKLPLWKDIISELKSELDLGDEESDYLRIAQLYYLEFGEFTYIEKLKSYFRSNLDPSLTHKLIFELNPQCIITTNWDDLLEKSISAFAYVYECVSSDKQLTGSTFGKKLVKIHGDFNSQNIVFKEDDYLAYGTNFPIIENYLKSILSTHTVLFLGYSYNDVNLKLIMKWILNRYQFSRHLLALQ